MGVGSVSWLLCSGNFKSSRALGLITQVTMEGGSPLGGGGVIVFVFLARIPAAGIGGYRPWLDAINGGVEYQGGR